MSEQCPRCGSTERDKGFMPCTFQHPPDPWHDQQYDLLKAISLLPPLTGQEPGLDLLAEILREMVRRLEGLEQRGDEKGGKG